MIQTHTQELAKLNALRGLMKDRGLDAYLVPITDAYQNEYVAPHDKRIRFLSGFSGSAGFIVVTETTAAFFTDSRYTLQAEQQLPGTLYSIHDVAKLTPSKWMEANIAPGMVVGFDPLLHTAKQVERLELAFSTHKIAVRAIEENLIDILWTEDRPPQSCAEIFPYETSYAGKASVLKRHELADVMGEKNINALVITDPASVAWLLNIRGDDVPHTPLPLSTAILRTDGSVDWFVDPRKASTSLDRELGSEVKRFAEDEFTNALRRLGESQARVLIDPELTPYQYTTTLKEAGAKLIYESDPIALPRACKNQREIDGMRGAHRRDGAALVRFLAWLDAQMDAGQTVTELSVEEQLVAFRAEGSLYKGESFATIAGFGPNGAIVHYRAKEETNKTLEKGSFLLLDSGAQYLDGTTDVTRTIPLGDISKEMKDRYTRVLKGHIALASARFPHGTSGAELDVLARQYLWAAGLDYGHGTGHGVGCYLCVHEGPQNISRRGTTPLEPGMVLSNEPGYYKARHYGIRLENLQVVIELFEISSNETKMLGFEPLTLVPFDRRAICTDMLTLDEKSWLNAYHTRVFKALRPQLDEASGKWLEKMTQAIS
ncbi:MAG: aminopeptidase P family protein [Proteobacteria bacterium]|jgi:Xaa-Pro aminopeptidase|nr:aminopeptidase P family protein [Alphaproteobacteria bacterium]NCC02435.1 aminopeptidase P family protein [Pseudomonadota bacterium]